MKDERDDKRPEDNAAGPTRSLDGSRFLMVEWLPDQAPPVALLKVIVNWFDELNEKCPPVGAK